MPAPPTFRRRTFFAASAALSGVWSELGRAQSTSPSEKLNIGVIGAGGRGVDNLAGIAGENVAALCDVDARFLGEAASRYPKARRFRDFRKLLDLRDLDAVIIATPDHTHAIAAAAAMRRGLHVYCEKPLAHNLQETELIARLARRTKIATQMGIQHHASSGYRRAVQILQAGVLGEVREVHAWTVRPVWPQGMDRPRENPPTPDFLAWNLWLGPAPQRPYHGAYHPRQWRGWWDFGTGALGDFLPHLLDPVYEGLRLTVPLRIQAKSSPVNHETAPKWSLVRFSFPPRGELPPVSVHWYDGGKQPGEEITGVKRLPKNGVLVLGTRAKLFIPSHGKPPIAIAANKGAAEKGERVELPEPLPPPQQTHWQQWTAACKSGKPTAADFNYGAGLTDVALLGNVALRVQDATDGKPIEWDAADRRVTNCPAANEFLGRDYRDGWRLE